MQTNNTIYDFLDILNEGYEKVIDSDYKEPNLITSSNILGNDVVMKFNYYRDEGLNSNFNDLYINVQLKETGEEICNISIMIIEDLFENSWFDIYEDCDNVEIHILNTFENIFFCYDDELYYDELFYAPKYLESNEDDFLNHQNCPIWINLNSIEITEKHRGKGYGQEILKHIINLLGLNSNYTVADVYTTEDIVFSVFPYPISAETDCPIEDFDLKLKMVQNFYKKNGFNDFKNKGYYVYNKK